MPIGLDDAQEEADKTILESRDDALCFSDSGGLRLLFQAPYLSVGTAGLSTVCESNIGRGPFRYLNGGSEYHPQIIWQWKKLPLLQSSIGSKEWLREQHLHVAVESDGVCIGEAQVPLLKIDEVETRTNAVMEKKEAAKEEEVTKKFAFASIVSDKDIKKGEKFNLDNIWVRRPGTGDFLAEDYQNILGRKALRDISMGEQIKKQDVFK